jgi:hypothetical protein
MISVSAAVTYGMLLVQTTNFMPSNFSRSFPGRKKYLVFPHGHVTHC